MSFCTFFKAGNDVFGIISMSDLEDRKAFAIIEAGKQ